MKKKILFLLLSFNFVGFVSAQQIGYPIENDKSIITLKALYKGYGKVFGNHFDGKKYIKAYVAPLTLTTASIIEAEHILFKNYKPYQTNKDAQRYFRFYYRQYIGFEDENGDSVVLINLLNFKNQKKGRHLFFSWENTYVRGFGEAYEKNQRIFLVNLSRENIEQY